MTFYENFWLVSLAVVLSSLFFLSIDVSTCIAFLATYSIAVLVVIFYEKEFVSIYDKLNNDKTN